MAFMGNQNAIGNRGGARPNKKIRKKQETFKGLVLDFAIKTMEGKDEDKKWQLVQRSINSMIPREMVGEDGEPIKLGVSLKVDLAKLDYERLLKISNKNYNFKK